MSWTSSTTHTEAILTDERDAIAALEGLCTQLAAGASATAIANLLGGVRGRSSGTIEIDPRDPAWQDAKVLLRGEETVNHVELVPNVDVDLTSLEAAFGDGMIVPRVHADDASRTSFEYDRPDLPATCAIIASLDGERVRSLTLRPDERLE